MRQGGSGNRAAFFLAIADKPTTFHNAVELPHVAGSKPGGFDMRILMMAIVLIMIASALSISLVSGRRSMQIAEGQSRIDGLNLAAQYADQIVLLHKGKSLRVGPPAAVYQRELLEQVFQTPLAVEMESSGRPRVTILPTS